MTATLSPQRVGRITGSRIAAVLGLSPYATVDDCLRQMVREAHGAEPEFAGNMATEWGNNHELAGVQAWEDSHGEPLRFTGEAQRFRVHPLVDFLGVTPDGLTSDGNVVEVKAPLWGGYSVWQDVPWYEAQCRLAAECVAAEWVDLVVWRPGGAVISRIERDPWWLETQMPALEAFIDLFETVMADVALYGPMLESLRDVRTDVEWSAAAARYRECVALERVAASHTVKARTALLALTDKPAKGAGVSVSRSERKGGIQYARAIEELAPGADLESYRKASSTVWSVRMVEP